MSTTSGRAPKSAPLPDPALCGCGARLPNAAAWERHIRQDLCTQAGMPRRIVQAAVERGGADAS